MLTRARFYLLNVAIVCVSLALAFGGRVAVRAIALPPTTGRIMEYLVIGLVLAACGGVISYASYRRVTGDIRLPPPVREDSALSSTSPPHRH
jgi:hypothetical protein